MTTESAKIVIDADDLASKKFEQAAKNAEQNIKAVKETGAKAKASTEFFGVLASTLGGSQLAGYAGQLGALTEKVSAFSEVSKSGGAGALAFKAGLVGVVAVITYQVTSAIAGLVLDIKGAEAAMAEALKGMDEAAQGFATAQSRRFQKDMAELQIGSAEEQTEKQTEKLRELNEELKKSGLRYQELKQQQDQLADSASVWDQYVSGASKEKIEDLEKLRQIEDENFKRLQAQQTAVRDLLDQETKEREARVESIKAAEKAEEEAAKKSEAAKKAAADEEERIAKAKVDAAKRIEDIRQGEIDKLNEEKILLTEGAEAAKRFALERQGIDKDSAARIASAEAELNKIKEEGERPASVEIGQQAVQSRLLSRGPAEKGIDKIEKNTKEALAKYDAMIQQLEKYRPQPMEIVG